MAILIPQLSEKPDQVISEIASSSAVWETAGRVRQYDVSPLNQAQEDGIWVIETEVVAPDFPTTAVTAYITLYNSQRSVVGYQKILLADQLDANETVSVQTQVLPFESAVQDAQLLVFGSK